ncbi:MAG: polysaccharide deacetylase family protein, partial [Planctomycetota bacterium]
MKNSDTKQEKSKPLASVSLDLDNLWSYMKTHGDPGWESFPSYLDTFIPLVLDVLDELGLRITFFIVGQDAALDKNRDVLGQITTRGHEVGNHSFYHDVWIGQYSKDYLHREILKAETEIERATGQKPQGFRGPGFCYNNNLLKVLNENNYLFDASMFPTSIGPLARFYYFFRSNFSREEKEKRRHLYGHL